MTSLATWATSDPAVAEFASPGVLTPKARGEVAVSAAFGALRSDVSWSVLVDPGQTARIVCLVSGFVSDADSAEPIPDARVEILRGYASETLTYRVDSPMGAPGGNPPTLNFQLRRTPR